MDLLFSYKGGNEFMNNVLLYFALKHDGDFEKVYNDIKAKVPVDENEFIKLKRGLKTIYIYTCLLFIFLYLEEIV